MAVGALAGRGTGGMSGESRVAWKQGMFLRPQHFQQQDRHSFAVIRRSIDPLHPFPWGLTKLKINEGLSRQSKFGIDACVGVLPDGQVFDIPGSQPPPAALDLASDTREATVCLTLPPHQDGEVEFEILGAGEHRARWLVSETDTPDAYSRDRTRERIETATLNLQLASTTEQKFGRICLPLAHVRAVQDGRLVFDDTFTCPVMTVGASPRLTGYLEEIAGLTEAQLEILAQRAVETSQGGADTFGPFLRLTALNRWGPRLRHLAHLPVLHPERLYQEFVSMAGELSTWSRQDRKAPPFPPYDHLNPRSAFEPTVEALRRALSDLPRLPAEQVPLEEVGDGAYRARITDSDRVRWRTGLFVLACKAMGPMDRVQQDLLRLTKIGRLERMEILERDALNVERGVRLLPIVTPPPQLKVQKGWVYFELDRDSAEWKAVVDSRGMGISILGEDIWQDLQVELWSIRQATR